MPLEVDVTIQHPVEVPVGNVAAIDSCIEVIPLDAVYAENQYEEDLA